ncbi:unnamed protein product [Dracunculus medinensis]|uniref:Uncharacterized protein n=1 Tax=Dracunculus medinensis TaxID=318479 RepID=A0A0N4U917_DRAME|nr:unnamed protein product [Dracunculus medinensis]
MRSDSISMKYKANFDILKVLLPKLFLDFYGLLTNDHQGYIIGNIRDNNISLSKNIKITTNQCASRMLVKVLITVALCSRPP